MNIELLKNLCKLHGANWINTPGKLTLNGNEVSINDIRRLFTCESHYPKINITFDCKGDSKSLQSTLEWDCQNLKLAS